MPSYNYLVERLYEMTQITVALAGLGVAGSVAMFFLYVRYEEMANYIRSDGLSQKFSEYKLGLVRAKRIKRGECPTHGTPLRYYHGKCPIKGCKEGENKGDT